jgi:ribonuclease VapC
LNAPLDRVVVDTSAILACCLGEAGYEQFESVLTSGVQLMMGAPNRLELGIVALNRNIQTSVEEALLTYQIQVEPFTASQATLAIAAFIQYGKGRHPAALNFGDCCAYALAKSMNLPLLYKGNDFAQTDIASALA